MKKNINIFIMTIALCCGNTVFTMEINALKSNMTYIQEDLAEVRQGLEKTEQKIKETKQGIETIEQKIEQCVPKEEVTRLKLLVSELGSLEEEFQRLDGQLGFLTKKLRDAERELFEAKGRRAARRRAEREAAAG